MDREEERRDGRMSAGKMRHYPERRTLRWIGLLMLPVALGLGMPAIAANHCRVQVTQGWYTGAGTATIVMTNTGQPCGGALYAVPQQNIPVDKITVVSPPKNGVVTIAVPRFAYAPNPGFVGDDRFELSAEGPERSRVGRITLRGTVLIRVER